jgi:hypothetical protein
MDEVLNEKYLETIFLQIFKEQFQNNDQKIGMLLMLYVEMMILI